MNINSVYAIYIIAVVLAVVLGEMLAQIGLLELAKHRRKRLRKQPTPPKPKSEPQTIEFNMALSGVDDVEVGLARVEAAMVRIADAAGGVPITVNNYYGKSEEVEE
jgi:hypothetical protein